MPEGWRNPFPFRFGGRAGELVGDLYATARAGTGSLMLGEDGTETDVENRVLARMVAVGYRAARRRANGADPMKLHAGRREVTFPDDGSKATLSPLERWERILRLTAPPTATLDARRRAVADRLTRNPACDRAALRALIDGILSPWTWSMDDPDVTLGPISFWQGATGSGGYPGSAPVGTQTWWSELGIVGLAITAPAGTTQTEKDRRGARLTAALDEVLPAFATFSFVIS